MGFPYLSLASALSEFAPLIARWIGGENNELHAQHIVEAARRVTGQSGKSDILKALRHSPHMVAQFQIAVLEMEKEMEDALHLDRQSARMRDISLVQAGHMNLRADIMVIAAAVGLISCLLTITFFKDTLPGEAVGIISTIAGIFGSCLKDAYAFEFGSSRGSKLKDSQIAGVINGGG